MNTIKQPENKSENQQEGNRNMPESSLKMFKGGNFYFDVNGQQVRVWFSSFSGKEEIYVNEALVSSNRSWRKISEHAFHLEGETYRVRVGVRNWSEAFKGIYIAELYRGKELIDEDEINMIGDAKEPFSWRKFGIGLLPWLIGGFIVGFLGSKFAFSLFS
ncbi:hypothetical protein [Aliidiomarina iranensis]|nr:hypothetical protein [Aliidiomarina iranensis]